MWKRAGRRDVSLPAHLQWHPPLARQRWGGPHAHQLPRLAQQPSGLRERGQPACLPAHSGYAGPGRWAGSPGASLRRRGEALCKPARHQQCWQTKVAGAAMPSAGGRATCPASLTRGCAGGLQVAWHPSAATCLHAPSKGTRSEANERQDEWSDRLVAHTGKRPSTTASVCAHACASSTTVLQPSRFIPLPSCLPYSLLPSSPSNCGFSREP